MEWWHDANKRKKILIAATFVAAIIVWALSVSMPTKADVCNTITTVLESALPIADYTCSVNDTVPLEQNFITGRSVWSTTFYITLPDDDYFAGIAKCVFEFHRRKPKGTVGDCQFGLIPLWLNRGY